jgi:hypothetical protein
MALFNRLIIRTFQLVFSAGTVFFSHDKSANSVFRRLISATERGQYLLPQDLSNTSSSLGPSDRISFPSPWRLHLLPRRAEELTASRGQARAEELAGECGLLTAGGLASDGRSSRPRVKDPPSSSHRRWRAASRRTPGLFCMCTARC